MKHIIAVLLCICLYTAAQACDVCGSGSSGQGLGMLPQFYKHFAGLQYQYRSYTATHPGLTEAGNQTSDDAYSSLQLWGRYQVGKRLQLFAFLPYQYNVQTPLGGSSTIQSGIGDVSLLANVVAVKQNDSSTGNAEMLLMGGGVKAPTGRHDGTLPNNVGLPEPQPGTGSWDFILNINYTVKKKNIGISTDASYVFTTANSALYKYGNRLSATARGFYSIQAGKVAILPQLGGKYEYALHDYDNYPRKWLNELTGGNVLYAIAGVQAYYQKIGMQIGYNYPLVQNYASGNVQVKPQFDAGVFLLF